MPTSEALSKMMAATRRELANFPEQPGEWRGLKGHGSRHCELASKIRELRGAGLTQLKIAAQLGISTRSVRNLLRPGEADRLAKQTAGRMARTDRLKKVAEAAGVSLAYARYIDEIMRCERIGEERRRQEAEEAKSRMKVAFPDYDVGQYMGTFRGWIDAFGRLGMVALAYQTLARQRGDIYASSFMEDIRDVCEKAQRRAQTDTDREREMPCTALQRF